LTTNLPFYVDCVKEACIQLLTIDQAQAKRNGVVKPFVNALAAHFLTKHHSNSGRRRTSKDPANEPADDPKWTLPKLIVPTISAISPRIGALQIKAKSPAARTGLVTVTSTHLTTTTTTQPVEGLQLGGCPATTELAIATCTSNHPSKTSTTTMQPAAATASASKPPALPRLVHVPVSTAEIDAESPVGHPALASMAEGLMSSPAQLQISTQDSATEAVLPTQKLTTKAPPPATTTQSRATPTKATATKLAEAVPTTNFSIAKIFASFSPNGKGGEEGDEGSGEWERSEGSEKSRGGESGEDNQKRDAIANIFAFPHPISHIDQAGVTGIKAKPTTAGAGHEPTDSELNHAAAILLSSKSCTNSKAQSRGVVMLLQNESLGGDGGIGSGEALEDAARFEARRALAEATLNMKYGIYAPPAAPTLSGSLTAPTPAAVPPEGTFWALQPRSRQGVPVREAATDVLQVVRARVVKGYNLKLRWSHRNAPSTVHLDALCVGADGQLPLLALNKVDEAVLERAALGDLLVKTWWEGERSRRSSNPTPPSLSSPPLQSSQPSLPSKTSQTSSSIRTPSHSSRSSSLPQSSKPSPRSSAFKSSESTLQAAPSQPSTPTPSRSSPPSGPLPSQSTPPTGTFAYEPNLWFRLARESADHERSSTNSKRQKTN
jgi:hypothetical protein